MAGGFKNKELNILYGFKYFDDWQLGHYIKERK